MEFERKIAVAPAATTAGRTTRNRSSAHLVGICTIAGTGWERFGF